MSTRRRFLALTATSTLAAIAGCQSNRQSTPLSIYVYNTAEITTQLQIELAQNDTTVFTSDDITITPDHPDDSPLFTLTFDTIRAGSEYIVTATADDLTAQDSITVDCTDHGGEKVAVRIQDAGELTLQSSSC
jgi:hypothetical protein